MSIFLKRFISFCSHALASLLVIGCASQEIEPELVSSLPYEELPCQTLAAELQKASSGLTESSRRFDSKKHLSRGVKAILVAKHQANIVVAGENKGAIVPMQGELKLIGDLARRYLDEEQKGVAQQKGEVLVAAEEYLKRCENGSFIPGLPP